MDLGAEIRTLPAALGEHSVEILREAGFSPADIEAMLADAVTLDNRPQAARSAAD